MGGSGFSFGHVAFEGHLRQLGQMSGRWMYVDTGFEPTELCIGDRNL